MGGEAQGEPEGILRVEGVTVSFEGFLALRGLDFSLDRGELRVVIGPNGAGKTTLLDVITGKVRPRSGRVLFQGRDITRLPEQEIARRGIGRKFQTPNIFKSLTVLENMSLALAGGRGVFAALTAPLSRAGHERIQEVLQTAGLTPRVGHLAGLLAHGEKQRLELAMLLVQSPDLLLLDEPVAGMTPRESERTGELLLTLAKRHTILVIEHDMTFVRQIAQKVTVLDEGQLLCEGTVQEVQRNPKVIEVYLGQDREDVEHPEAIGVLR
jgi:urea transport system ATP-binding protein